MKALTELVRDNILQLKPYSSARDEFKLDGCIQLDANENPFESGYNRYPDPYQNQLKQRLCDLKGMQSENLILGNGSDELIDLIIRTFCNPGIDNIIGLKPSYGMYQVSAAINDAELIEVALNGDFSLNVQRVLDACTKKTKLIFLCSPNNPTGNTFSSEEIDSLLNAFDGIVIIDEAYIDFSDQSSWTDRLSKFPQLVVLQTLSKSFGLASLRLGLAWASPELIAILNKVKPPYNVNGASQSLALKALENEAELNLQIQQILNERAWLEDELNKISIVQTVYPSEANFLLVKVDNANKLYEYLCANGVVVRNRTNQYGCVNCLRLSVGTPEENKELINRLKEF
ncbi:MAG: histidinol-phosphate transaminase [Crocinitomicaceae bacterium]